MQNEEQMKAVGGQERKFDVKEDTPLAFEPEPSQNDPDPGDPDYPIEGE